MKSQSLLTTSNEPVGRIRATFSLLWRAASCWLISLPRAASSSLRTFVKKHRDIQNIVPRDHLLRCSPCGVTTFVFVRCIHPASEPASQPGSQLRHHFLNFLSCSKTASLFIVFFIKFAFLAQRARGYFRTAANV